MNKKTTIKALLALLTVAGVSSANNVVSETRYVETVGVNISNDNQTMYLKVQGGVVGPAACSNSTMKVDLSDPDRRSGYELAMKIAIAAKASSSRVRVTVPMDQCVHGAPTFHSITLVD